jgi:Tol biopolymer transport system component/predicted Ser/Thr protein kinase
MIGQAIAHYQITAKLGEGGMGEVYRARDTKLGREVALKILPPAFAADADRMARFEREAKLLASLNHPNIAQVYGVEEHALVMELVEGESPKGPLPFEDAWKIASQIAFALEYAHEKGIVHRDLKPANVKVTPDGVVKLLDFGLAKAFTEPKEPSGNLEQSPTLTIGATEVGVILGTAAYMAPEQAKGKSVDKRADIWAFGVVLFELLTGARLFKGEDVAETLAQVLTKQPYWQGVPAKARRLLQECLQKDPTQRLRDIGDAVRLLGDDSAQITPLQVKQKWLLPSFAVMMVLAFGALAFIHFREKPPEALVERFTIPAPRETAFNFNGYYGGPVEVSPDGRRLVFSASTADGKTQLWVRALASLTSVPLAGTEGASFPFWSADSKNIGFFAEGKLKRIDAGGGPPLTLCDAPMGFGGTWNREGVIVFAPQGGGPLYRVSASGGTSSPVTELDSAKHEGTHFWPWFLPDGRHFLYWAGDGTIRVASIDTPGHNSRVIIPSQLNAIYSQGYLLFLRGNTLMAQPFDTNRLSTTTDAVTVAEQIQTMPGSLGRAVFSVSANGFLVYRTAPLGQTVQLAWFDRSAKQTATLGQPETLYAIRLSPDRKSASVAIVDAATGNLDIWLYDVARGLKTTRFTSDPAQDANPTWSPDGRWIVFNSNRKGHFDLYRKPSNGTGVEELLYADEKEKLPTSFSPNGKLLLYTVYSSKNQLWILPLDGTPTQVRKPVPFASATGNSTWGEFSPDGRWIAFASDESKKNEVYVAPYPGPGRTWLISTAGGDQPLWRSDGKEIFYISPDRRLMAAKVGSNGDEFKVGAVRPLFGPIPQSFGRSYDVSEDGQRFLVRTVAQQGDAALTLVQNWSAGLKK